MTDGYLEGMRSTTGFRCFWLCSMVIFLIPLGPVTADESPPWQFAASYSRDDVLRSPQMATDFVNSLIQYEAPFFALARDPKSGLTFDGWNLDPETGQPKEARRFSAASKECLDLGLLVKALYADPCISRLVSPTEPQLAPEIAVSILAQKIESYEKYRADFAGFGGCLTWFESGAEAKPMGGWQTAFPTLDHGEMVWAMLLAEKALRDSGHPELAARYAAYNQDVMGRAKEMMFHPPGVRGRVEISDPKSTQASYRGEGLTTGEHGVHEGQMIVLYVTLFGGLTPAESDLVWQGISMRRMEHQYGTTWQGFWGSPHEEWAYLFLPYFDLPEYRQLFRIREKIRSQNAAQRGYPGFGASAHHPLGQGYMSAVGIEGVGSQTLEHQDTYTPYGAFPMLLEFADRPTEPNLGLAWLHNMLLGPRMQGPFGAAESGDNAGTGVAPIKTIDASFTTLLALSGGLQKETAALLREMGKYDEFVVLMRREYREAFSDGPLREPFGFALPAGPAPGGVGRYPELGK